MEQEKHITNKVEEAWGLRVSNLRKAFDLGLQILSEAKQINSTRGVAGAYKILGYCYWRFSDYSKSLKYSLKAIEIYKSLGDRASEADALNNLGAVYMFQKEHAKRLACNLECLRIREEIGEEISGSQANIGETYLEMGDLENATIWLNTVLKNQQADKISIAWANFNLGKIYEIEGKTTEAIDFVRKSLDISLAINYSVLSVESYLELAKIYIDSNQLPEAKKNIEEALSFACKIGSKEYEERAYLLFSDYYEKKGDVLEAFNYFKKYHNVHEELFNKQKEEEIKEINFQYELSRANREADLERKKTNELKKAYEKIEAQNELIEQKNSEFIDSVTYAKQIQQAFLSGRKLKWKRKTESFLIFHPKDIVSGDFYWSTQIDNHGYLVVGDCTGHGVPGAFLTMLGIAYLKELISPTSKLSPKDILDLLREKIIKDLSSNEAHRDGMDISIVKVNFDSNEVEWAGAKNPLWIIRKGADEIEEIKGDRQSVCYNEELLPFTNHVVELKKGDQIYLFSDGYFDQFGGEKGKKMGRKKMQQLLLRYRDKSMVEQKSHLVHEFSIWKGNQEQLDDICVAGVRL